MRTVTEPPTSRRATGRSAGVGGSLSARRDRVEQSQRFPELGLGVYSFAEASRYAGIRAARLRAWFRGGAGGGTRKSILANDYANVDEDSALGFLELIEAFVVGRFRNAGVSMSEIRGAHQRLEAEFGWPHPFAHLRFRTTGRRILAAPPDRDGERAYFDPISRNYWLPDLVDGLARIDYSPETGLAARWRIAEGVAIDPRLALGKPVVIGSGVTTRVLARQFEANGRDVSRVADIYGVTDDAVASAVRFESGLRAAA